MQENCKGAMLHRDFQYLASCSPANIILNLKVIAAMKGEIEHIMQTLSGISDQAELTCCIHILLGWRQYKNEEMYLRTVVDLKEFSLLQIICFHPFKFRYLSK